MTSQYSSSAAAGRATSIGGARSGNQISMAYTLAHEAGLTGYWRNLYAKLCEAEDLTQLKQSWDYCNRVADKRHPHFQKLVELKNILYEKWHPEMVQVINQEMAPLLNRPFVWFEKLDPPDPGVESYMHGGATSAAAMGTMLGLGSLQAAHQALYNAQSYYKSVSLDYFNCVVAQARRKGIDFSMPWQVWMPLLSETAIHVMLVGETGSGKSLLGQLLAVVRSWTGQVIIFDPHAIQPAADHPGDWGMPVIGAGRAYGEINAYMGEIIKELSNRYSHRKDGVEAFENLTVFIDEWPSIRANCSQAGDFMKTLAREGRKVNMRLVILSQSALVESLGIRGEGDTRDNFTILHLGKFAKKILKANWAESERPYVLDWAGELYTLNGRKLPDILEAFRQHNPKEQKDLLARINVIPTATAAKTTIDQG